jgi:hypothetical protein
MTRRGVHIQAGAVFVRLFWWFFVLREAYVWVRWIRPIRAAPGLRVLVFLFRKWATPRSLLFALLFAALATLVLELLVRMVLRPLVRHWHTPWTDESDGLFHLSAQERVVTSTPARRAGRRRGHWLAGTLVCTNLRVWFFPRAHDAEIWSCPLDRLDAVHLEPAPRVAWGLIQGWPQRLALRAVDAAPGGEGEGGGHLERFAVLEPEAVLTWFHPAEAVGAAPSNPATPLLSSPRRP